MRSSNGILQNHYLKNDVSLINDEPEPEPQQQQKISSVIIKNVVETPLKQIKNKIVVDEAIIIKEVEQNKNKNELMKNKT